MPQVADDAGEALLSQTYDPYGNLYARAGADVTSYGFTGEQADSSGLLYLRARYYAPLQGRFFQPDPSRQEMNPYQYAAGNPINRVDPTGNINCLAPTTEAEVLFCVTWEAFKANTEVIWQQSSEAAVEVIAPVIADTALPTVLLWLAVAHQMDKEVRGTVIRTVAACDLIAVSLAHSLTEPVYALSAVYSGDDYVSYFSSPEYETELEEFRAIVTGVEKKNEEDCNADAFTTWWFSLESVSQSHQPGKDWYEYEQRVARQNGVLGDFARTVESGKVNADGIEPTSCCFVDAKFIADPSSTQFRADAPFWIFRDLVDEFERYRNAIITSNGVPNAQPKGLIIRTNEADSRSLFEQLLQQAGFTVGVDGTVQIVH